MAQVTEKIIEVKAKVEGEKTVKELKEQVAELTRQMDSLDNTTEEYQQTVDKLVNVQEELTTAMKVGKSQLSANEGSYNALVNRMAALKKAHKSVTDEFTRNRLSEEIDSINDQLKAMDAANGVYVRNVGNYENAIRAALKTPQQELKALRTELAQLEEGTDEYNAVFTRMADLTHQVTEQQEMLKWSSADLGDILGNLSGVATSLAGGFSAFNALMGLMGGESEELEKAMLQAQRFIQLIQGLEQFEQLGDKISGLTKGLKGFLSNLFKTNDALEGNAQSQNAATEAASMGTNATTESTVATQANTVATNAQSSANVAATTTTGLFSKALGVLKTALISTGIGAIVVALGSLVALLGRGAGSLWNWINGTTKANEQTEKLEKTTEKLKENLEIEEGAWIRQEMMMRAQGKSYEEIYQARRKNLKQQLEIVQTALAEQKAINDAIGAKELQKKKYDSYRKTLQEIQDIEKKLEETISDHRYQNHIDHIEEETKAENERAEANQRSVEAIIEEYEREKESAEQLYNSLIEHYKDDETKLKEKYEDEKALLEKFGKDTTNLTKKYEEDKAAIAKKVEEDALKEAQERFKKRMENLEKEMQAKRNLMDFENERKLLEYEQYASEQKVIGDFTNNYLTQMRLRWSVEDEIFNKRKERLEEEIKLYKEEAAKLPETSTEKATLLTKIAELERQLALETADYTISQNERKKESTENYFSFAQESLGGISTILDNVASAWETSIENQINSGKISEEEGERQLEEMKDLQSAIALINALSSAVAAYNSVVATPFIGVPLAIAAAASALASGLAQVKAIQSVKKGDSSGGNTTRYAEVTPTTPDYNPTAVTNVTSSQETENLANAMSKSNLWVSVKDIDDTQSRVKTREKESTF